MLNDVRFNTALNLTNDQSSDGDWFLVEDFCCTLMFDDERRHVVVPKGFRTDLASSPRILWPILPPFGRWSAAAVLHDYLYRGTKHRALPFVHYVISHTPPSITAYTLYKALPHSCRPLWQV